jgi:hypothetical protein
LQSDAYVRALLAKRVGCSNSQGYGKVPLGRYFFFVGGLLLALLFFADWYLPNSAQTFMQDARVDRSFIRIKSAHKWPEKTVIDTSLPTIVPPQPTFATGPDIISHPREAYARLNTPSQPASVQPAPIPAKRKIMKIARSAPYQPIREGFPPGW